MMTLIVAGMLFTLLIVGGGAFAFRMISHGSAVPSGKRRHRDEARLLQARFDEDDDFARNFHRPTQNEVLETLQTLDQLTPAWEQDDATLADRRFKNELAESFPSLRREDCGYPATIEEDVARLSGKTKLAPTALALRLQSHTTEMARRRETIQAARAQANALHQLASGPDEGPLELTPGSLPFRVSDDAGSKTRPKRRSMAGVVALAACLAAVLSIAMNPGLRSRAQALLPVAYQKGWEPDAQPKVVPSESASPVPAVAETTPAPAAEVPANAGSAAPPVATAQTEAAPSPATSSEPPVAAQAPATPPPPLTEAAKPTLAQEVAASQLRAIDKYPALAVPNSEMNLRFVFRYKNLLATKSERLQDPSWPEKLAEECAAAVAGTKGKKFTQVTAVHR